MKTVIRFVVLCLILIATRSFAVEVEVVPATPQHFALVESQSSSVPFEFDFEETYVGNGDVERGNRGNLRVRDFDVNETKGQFVWTPRIKFGILRLGFQNERIAFGYSTNAPIPDVLQSSSLVIGLDTEFSESFLIRIEAQPGFYRSDWDDTGSDTFNVPVVVGGTYIFSSSFQVFFGLGIDPLRQYPVLPGGGIRWKFAPQWTLNAVAPVPRLEYELSNNLMFYLGADIRSTSYRVGEHFGIERGNTALNHAAVTFNELRVGGGFEWKITSELKISAEGGLIPYRDLDFHRTEVRYHEDGGVPYAMLSLHAAF